MHYVSIEHIRMKGFQKKALRTGEHVAYEEMIFML